MTQTRTCDVLVIGAGAGGMSTALTARLSGLDVLVIEKQPEYGGSMALSGGWLWLPLNPLAVRAGVADSKDDVRKYLRFEAGDCFDEDRVEAFLEKGPEMVEFFEKNTSLQFVLGTEFPDYHSDQPGAKLGGRPICAQPINGRELKASISLLKRSRRELLVFGIAIHTGPDLKHFMAMQRSLGSAWYVAKRFMQSRWDRALYGRDMKLGNGAALAARLLISAQSHDIPILLSTPAKTLIEKDGVIRGAIVEHEGRLEEVIAKRGVVLATGGFPGDFLRRAKYFSHSPGAEQHISLAPPSNTGDGLTLGVQAGGSINDKVRNAAPWMPVSRVPYPDGSIGAYPHVFDRGKPGIIAVRADGKRFVNESASYQEFVPAMVREQPPGSDISVYLVADHKAIRKYGLGFAKPAPMSLKPHLRSGYLLMGHTIEELAQRAGIDPVALRSTINLVNNDAANGQDSQFGRGSSVYNRFLGDAAHSPNPCVAALTTPPFYAVKVVPGDLGTFIGLRTDRHSRVLGKGGQPIPGLYAVGADSTHAFGGAYPGGGATLGPAFTFGYIAGRHLALSGKAGAKGEAPPNTAAAVSV